MATSGHLAALLLAVTLVATPPTSAQTASAAAQTLFGQGRGVDHVGIGVRDLSQARHDYEQLGFKVIKGGHFPGGLANSVVFFQHSNYLELLAVSGSTPATKGDASDVADFVKKHEGAMFLGISVASAKAAASYLRAHNFDVTGPDPGSIMAEGQTTPPPPMWYDVSVNDKPAAGKQGVVLPIFFVEYVSADRLEKRRAAGDMDQPNTAIGIHAVWFAVKDSEAQSRTLHDAGFEAGASREAKFIGGYGREVKAGQGALVLLESSGGNGPLTKYLSDHDEGIIGVSIEVADLSKARRLAETATGRKLETYKGFYGASFMLPPSLTHGLWLEMYQPAKRSQ